MITKKIKTLRYLKRKLFKVVDQYQKKYSFLNNHS